MTKVPSVQIYDPDGVTRLADVGPCMPDDFPRLERKVDVVIRSMQKRRSAHKVVARSYAAELCHMRSQDCAPSPSSVSRMSEEEFEAFEAAVCAICPPQGRLRGALRTTGARALRSGVAAAGEHVTMTNVQPYVLSSRRRRRGGDDSRDPRRARFPAVP